MGKTPKDEPKEVNTNELPNLLVAPLKFKR